MTLLFRMALRNLFRHTRRSFFTGGLACVAAMASILSLGYMSATFYTVGENTIRSGIGHFQLAKPAQFDGVENNPLEHGLTQSQQDVIATSIKRVLPDAELLPRIGFQGVVSAGDQSLIFLGTALDPQAEGALSPTAQRVVEGEGLEHVDPDNIYQILIGQELARLLDVTVGDDIAMMTPTADGGLNAADVTVVGLASLGVKEVDRTYVAAPIGLAQNLLRRDTVASYAVALPQGTSLEETKLAITQASDAIPNDIELKGWRELAPLYDQLVQVFSSQFTMFGIVIAAMIILTLLNTVAMSILERRKESATMMSMGFRRGYIRRLYVIEGSLLGFIGAIIGALLSIALILWVNNAQIVMPPPPGSTQGYLLTLFLESAAIYWTVGAITLLALIAAWFASGAVKEKNIAETLNHA